MIPTNLQKRAPAASVAPPATASPPLAPDAEQDARERDARRRALPELAEARALIERMEGRPIQPCTTAPDIAEA